MLRGGINQFLNQKLNLSFVKNYDIVIPLVGTV